MIKINLVPQEILDRELQRQRGTQVAAVASLLGVVVLVVSVVHYQKSVRLSRQLKEDQAKLDKLQVIVAKVEELDRAAQTVRARLNIMQDLLASRSLYPRFMEELLKTLPSGGWLTNLTTAADGNGLRVTAAAKTLSSEDVAQWLRTLEKSDRFKEPSLGPIAVDATDRTNSFTMTSRYVPPEGKP